MSDKPPMPSNLRMGLPSWRSYWFMAFLFIIGALAAVGQHFFYSYLNGREVDELIITQTWVIRIGNAFGFLFNYTVVSAVGIAFCHRFWFSVRREAFSVGAIDSIFNVLDDPLQFLNFEAVFKAKILFLVAGIAWLIPLSSIFGPGALTVIPEMTTSANVTSAPVLGSLGSDVGFVRSEGAGNDNGQTDQLLRIAHRVLTNGETITPPSPCGSNCSYTVSFLGPAYQCVTLDLSSASVPNLTSDAVNPYDPAVAPAIQYYAVDPGSTIVAQQGLWFVIAVNSTVHCSLFNATYTTNVTYENNLPVTETTITYHQQINDSTTNLLPNILEQPNSANISLQWSLLNMYAVHQAIETRLLGYVVTSPVAGAIEGNNNFVQMTSLVVLQPQGFRLVPDFAKQMENTMNNVTLSLTQFLVQPVINAIPGSNSSDPATYINTNATIISYPTRYTYSASILWGPYAASLLGCAFCVCIGFCMLVKNGVAADKSFSQILVATRNPAIDIICVGAGLGGIPEELEYTKLKFGEITGEGHAGFGLPNEV